jgi:membrane-bound metal-dependent hydrolase YbcI (DUF457 family)
MKMRRKTHIIAALAFSFTSYLIYFLLEKMTIPRSINSLIFIFGNMNVYTFFIIVIFSFLGGILPDILDPPITSRHRKYAHSKILLLSFFIIWLIVLFSLKSSWNVGKASIFFFITGYLSHLVLDSFTSAGLW